MSAQVEHILKRITDKFGPGANGVSIIFERDDLPEHFNVDDWQGWFFKPAREAFAWAHDAGLITPWKLGSKWTLTPLGRQLAATLAQKDTQNG